MFHSNGITFFADALKCNEGWLPTVDIVSSEVDVTRHQRLEVYPTEVAAKLASFADAYHLSALIRRTG